MPGDPDQTHRLQNPWAILLVDDDDLTRVVLTQIIGMHWDGEILQAGSAEEARQLVTRYGKRIRLIFMDLAMPLTNGLELCAEIRAIPGQGHTPVVMVTADEVLKIEQQAQQAGIERLLRKPIFVQDIRAVLEHYFGTESTPPCG
jgi:CheY-like chemotaxis protein